MIIKVRVRPASGREEIEKTGEDSYKVYLKKPAEDNLANLEMIRLLKKFLKRDVKIVRGGKSRDKIIQVAE